MNTVKRKTIFVRVLAWLSPVAAVFLTWQVADAAKPPHFDSHLPGGALAIDGKFDDWSGNLEPLGENPMSIQVANDGAYLYLRMTASDAGTRMEITRLGMTVWFDPAGGTRKKLGIRYPAIEEGTLGVRWRRPRPAGASRRRRRTVGAAAGSRRHPRPGEGRCP